MEHDMAVETRASERYLLNEMSEEERLAFEAHYFECEACAEDVRTNESFVRGVKAVGGEFPLQEAEPEKSSLKKWFKWFFPGSLAPVMAAAAMTVAIYQSFVVIPALRANLAPQSIEPVVLHAAARGQQSSINVESDGGVSILALDVISGEPGQPVDWELSPPQAGAPVSGKAKVPPIGGQFTLLIPNSILRGSGQWSLVLRNAQGTESGPYLFQVTNTQSKITQ